MTGFEFIGVLPEAYIENPVHLQCVSEASSVFDIPDAIAKGFLAVENGRVQRYRWNSNGTTDWGPFQINVINFAQFGEFGVTPRDILFDFCTNANAALFYARFRASKAVTMVDPEQILYEYALYHSGTKVHRQRYFNLLKNNVSFSYE